MNKKEAKIEKRQKKKLRKKGPRKKEHKKAIRTASDKKVTHGGQRHPESPDSDMPTTTPSPQRRRSGVSHRTRAPMRSYAGTYVF